MVEVITVPELVAWSRGGVPDDETAELVVGAVNGYVLTLPVADTIVSTTDETTGTTTTTIPGAVKLGALMLAARSHRRRMSPNGIEAVTGESIAYVARYDPEISRYLALDAPRVG